eukprot:Clim_evm54s108 gene=Clim_evmTU54s108
MSAGTWDDLDSVEQEAFDWSDKVHDVLLIAIKDDEAVEFDIYEKLMECTEAVFGEFLQYMTEESYDETQQKQASIPEQRRIVLHFSALVNNSNVFKCMVHLISTSWHDAKLVNDWAEMDPESNRHESEDEDICKDVELDSGGRLGVFRWLHLLASLQVVGLDTFLAEIAPVVGVFAMRRHAMKASDPALDVVLQALALSRNLNPQHSFVREIPGPFQAHSLYPIDRYEGWQGRLFMAFQRLRQQELAVSQKHLRDSVRKNGDVSNGPNTPRDSTMRDTPSAGSTDSKLTRGSSKKDGSTMQRVNSGTMLSRMGSAGRNPLTEAAIHAHETEKRGRNAYIDPFYDVLLALNSIDGNTRSPAAALCIRGSNRYGECLPAYIRKYHLHITTIIAASGFKNKVVQNYEDGERVIMCDDLTQQLAFMAYGCATVSQGDCFEEVRKVLSVLELRAIHSLQWEMVVLLRSMQKTLSPRSDGKERVFLGDESFAVTT